MENKKIKNATVTISDGIQFKSKLEETCYKTLLQAGFNPDYELVKFVLIEGFKPTVPFYNRVGSEFKLDNSKIRNLTYTPDFTFTYKNTLIIIEAKGMENDTFPIKKKLFRRFLEDMEMPSLFFEIRTKKELLQAIETIRSYEPTT